MRAPATVFAVGLLASGCFIPGRNRPAPAPRQSPARDSLLAIDLARTELLGQRGIASAMRAVLEPSVIYLRAGAYAAFGPDAALRLLESPNPRMAPFTAWQPIGGGISKDQLTGYTFGIAVRTQPELPGAMIERYIAVWSRSRSSPWRIVAYIEVTPGSLSSISGQKTSATAGGTTGAHALFVADSVFGERASALGPAAAMRENLSDDGVLLATTQLVVGPRAASDYFESRRSLSVSWIPRDARIAASGDLGFTIGDALSTSLGPTGAATQRFTKYLTVWRKDEDGRWRVVVTGANDRPSPIGE